VLKTKKLMLAERMGFAPMPGVETKNSRDFRFLTIRTNRTKLPVETRIEHVRQLRNDRTGLGLGLSLARKAVRAHGGDIHIRNFPDKGCVFVIDTPLAPKNVPLSPGVSV
jgi:nitrogen fixation/metabolism regulation signal transduction histidine kinase